MKVRNMESRNGNTVPNQFIITDDNDVEWFQSYQTIIAKNDHGSLTLDENTWNYSVTTSKYRNIFTGYDTQETKKHIKSGAIKLEDLN